MARFTFGQQFSSGLQNERDRQLRRQAQRAQERLRSRKIQQTKELAQQRMQNERQLQEDQQEFRSNLLQQELDANRENTIGVSKSRLGVEGEGKVQVTPGQLTQLRATEMRQSGRGPQVFGRVSAKELGLPFEGQLPVTAQNFGQILPMIQQQRQRQARSQQIQNMIQQIGQQLQGQQQDPAENVPRGRGPLERFGQATGITSAAQAVGDAASNLLFEELGEQGQQTARQTIAGELGRLGEAMTQPPQQRAQTLQDVRSNLGEFDQRLSGFQETDPVNNLRTAIRQGARLAQEATPSSQRQSGADQMRTQILQRIAQRMQEDDLSADQLINLFSETRKAKKQNQR